MKILCLWSPDWQIDEAFLAEGFPILMDEVPRVAIERERGIIWADVRGLPGVRIAESLRARLGDGVRAGLAGVPIAAEGLARSGEGVRKVEAGQEAKAIAELPLTLLTREERLLALLEGVGIRNCGELATLTAEAAEVRFGSAGTALWRLARAEDPRILFRPIPPQLPHASIDFVDYAVRDAEGLVFTLNALLEQICATLNQRSHRARRLVLTFHLSDGSQSEKILRTARPTADQGLWLRRIRTVLEKVQLGDTITGVSLQANSLEGVSALQGDLFDRGFSTASFVEEAVARLMDLYQGLFVRQTRTDHPLAERRTQWVDLTPPEAAATRTAASENDDQVGDLPPALQLQLLNDPRPIRVESRGRRDHALPVRFQSEDRWQHLTAAGPDRISGGHEEAPYAREYFRCVSESGAMLWIYRDALEDSWYLHGWWD